MFSTFCQGDNVLRTARPRLHAECHVFLCNDSYDLASPACIKMVSEEVSRAMPEEFSPKQSTGLEKRLLEKRLSQTAEASKLRGQYAHVPHLEFETPRTPHAARKDIRQKSVVSESTRASDLVSSPTSSGALGEEGIGFAAPPVASTLCSSMQPSITHAELSPWSERYSRWIDDDSTNIANPASIEKVPEETISTSASDFIFSPTSSRASDDRIENVTLLRAASAVHPSTQPSMKHDSLSHCSECYSTWMDDNTYDPASPAFIEKVPEEIIQAKQEELVLKRIAALQNALSNRPASDESPSVRAHYEHVLHEFSVEFYALRARYVASKDLVRGFVVSVSASAPCLDSATTSSSASVDNDEFPLMPEVSPLRLSTLPSFRMCK